ncbi:uncharacterized protein F4822DRAFT_398831 [Hypoxylon trugodes]|uniref:uncharacterized protein n=1 Tax=Hypoxylon trugodes TaxID=326681 RepID=UPI00219CEECA|nr:uncharacterized protein F4822DRAFT_398831 [Hypoxylon trugodes]KAI1389569.1 hypothetical protein F4822DRAFT_398831 [Hypoxylon trugodes]
MIFFNSSCLRSGHDVLFRSWAILRPTYVPSRASSLSAIHRGLRNSEKARAQGFKKTALNTARSKRGLPEELPTFKIKKGKKDITFTTPKPKSRRARFYDPDEEFGKKSLVYQLGNGPLRRKLGDLSEREQPEQRGREDRVTRSQFFKDFESSSGQKSSSDRNDRGGRDFSRRSRSVEGKGRSRPSSRFSPSSNESRAFGDRTSNNSRDFARPPRDRFSSSGFQRKERDFRQPLEKPAESRAFGELREPRENRERERYQKDEEPTFRQTSSRDSGPKDSGSIRLHRTTAASQFLYGRSVVEAALKNTTRQLYNLYLYCGENRRDASGITGLERQANQVGVTVKKVTDNVGLRMMDKMSDGRPHNGCVLEASPLPQLPLRSLGEWTEEPTPGFSIALAHQSVEEAQVNGTSDFVECTLPPGRKPFVLLLDGILDPGNLGAILRSAAFLGVNAIGITKGHSATLTSVALKASAGASEVVKLFSVDTTLNFLTRSKEAGWVVYAAVAPGSRPREGKHLTPDRVESYDPLSSQPTILMVGSEGEGLSSKTRRMADYEVSIPNHSGSSAVESLNVSVATGVLCSAFLKKQYSDSKFDKIIEVPDNDDESQQQLW